MPAPIPILLMVRELNLGGSERQMAEIAKALDRAKFDPHAGCFRAGGLRADDLRQAGVPVVNFDVPSIMSLKGAWQIVRYIREKKIRLVHTFDTPANLYGVPAARVAASAIVLSSQRVDRSLWPPMQHHGLRLTDRMVDGVVVNCEFLRRHLQTDEKVPADLIHLCYNGIDTAVFQPGSRSKPDIFADAQLVIGVVCALRPEKGLRTLLQAFAEVRPLAAGIKLLIVGSGPCREDLQREAAALDILASCRFEPATSQVAEWLQAIDIFVLPSHSEAFSNSLMEAMACGCCVAASRVGGNPELVAEGETGMLFEAGNAQDLARVLRTLVAGPELRTRLAANATDLIQRKFSLETSARRMGEIYSEFLG